MTRDLAPDMRFSARGRRCFHSNLWGLDLSGFEPFRLSALAYTHFPFASAGHHQDFGTGLGSHFSGCVWITSLVGSISLWKISG